MHVYPQNMGVWFKRHQWMHNFHHGRECCTIFKELMLSHSNIALDLKGNIGCKSNFFLGCKRSTSNANLLKYPTNVYPGKAMPTLMWIPYSNWPINSSKTGFVQSITGCTMDIRIFQLALFENKAISSKFKGLPWLDVHPHSWTSKFTHGLDHVEPLLFWEKSKF